MTWSKPLFAIIALGTLAQAPAPSPAVPRLSVPIACVIGQTCEIQNYVDRDPGPGAKDYRCGARSYDAHSGLDIRLLDMAAQRRGVNVLAAADGKVLRVRDGVADVSVRTTGVEAVKGQECGNGLVVDHGGGLSTQYCHMAKGSLVVKPGDPVRTGQPLGRVGLSGQTEYPHLHMSVMRDGKVIDPFAPSPSSAPGQCGSGQDLWTPAARAALAYKARAVLNIGFAPHTLTMEQIEAGDLAKADRQSQLLVAYVRAIGLKAGDIQALTLTGPDGKVLSESPKTPLPRDQAQRFVYVGKQRPASGWPTGPYTAVYVVSRDGAPVLRREFQLSL